MLKAKSSEKFLSPKICKILTFQGPWGLGCMKSFNFYCKRHILAWIHVDWAILSENRLRGLTSRAVGEKLRVTRGSHRNDASPLTQGLRYRAACDGIILQSYCTSKNWVHFLPHSVATMDVDRNLYVHCDYRYTCMVPFRRY